MKIAKVIFELITLGIIILFINLIGFNEPSIMIITLFFSIIPMVIVELKYKEISALILSTIVFAISALIFSPTIALIQFCCYFIIGTSLGYCLRNKYSLKLSIVLGMASTIATLILIYFIVYKTQNINIIQNSIIDNTMRYLENNKSSILDSLKSGKEPPEVVYENMLTTFNIALIFIPGLVTAASFIWSYSIIAASVGIAKKIGYKNLEIQSFSEIKIPIGFAFLIIVFMLIVTDNQPQYSVDKYTVVITNLIWITEFLFVVQGMALIDFWIKKVGVTGLLRLVVYTVMSPIFLVLTAFGAPIILFFIGVADAILDFRKLEAR